MVGSLKHLSQVDSEAVQRDISGSGVKIRPIEVVSVEVTRSYRRDGDVYREEAKLLPPLRINAYKVGGT